MISWLYDRPTLLTRITIVFSLWPLFVILLWPQTFTAIALSVALLYVFRLYGPYQELKAWYGRNNVQMRYHFILFVIFTSLTIWVFWQLIGIKVTPVFILFFFLLLSFTTVKGLQTYPSEVEAVFVRASHTGVELPRMNSDLMITAGSISIYVSIVVILFISFVKSMASQIFLTSELVHLIIIPVVLLHLQIDHLLRRENTWEGSGELISSPDLPNDIPSVDNYLALTEYVRRLVLSEFNPEFFKYIEENIEQICKKSVKIEYTGFVRRLIHLYLSWGKRTRPYAHLLVLIMASSLRRYRVLGLIPIPRRYNLYAFLSYLKLVGIADQYWQDQIRFEIKEEKDDFDLIYWTEGIDRPVDNTWMIILEGMVYKGGEGYKKLLERDLPDYQKPEPSSPWVADIYNYCFNYLSLFAGVEGRQALAERDVEEGIMDGLALGMTAEEATITKSSVSERFVGEQIQVHHRSNDPVGRRQMEIFMAGGDVSETPREGWKEELAYLYQSYRYSIRAIDVKMVLSILGLILLAVVNGFLFGYLRDFVDLDILSILLAIEIVILQLLSVSSTETDLMSSNRVISTAHERAATKRYQSFSLSDATEFDKKAGFILVYSFLLIFSISYFFF